MMVMMVMMVHANYEHLLLNECIVTNGITILTYDSIVSFHLANKRSDCPTPYIRVNGYEVTGFTPNSNPSSWTKGYLKLNGYNSVFSTDLPDEPNQTKNKFISVVKLRCVHYYMNCPQAKPNYGLNRGNTVMIPRLGQDYEELLVFVPKGGDFTLTTVDGNNNNYGFECNAETSNVCQLNSASSNWVKIGLHFTNSNVKVQVNGKDQNTWYGNQVNLSTQSEEILCIIQCNGTCGDDGNNSATATGNDDPTEQPNISEYDQQILIYKVIVGFLSAICVVMCLAHFKSWAGRKERGQVSTESDTRKATAMTSLPGHNNSQPGISHHNNLVHDEANDLYEPLDGVGLNSKKPNMGMSSSTVFTEVNDVYESFDHQKMKPTRPAAPTATSYDEVNDVYESFDQTKHSAF
ncbi:hypothetical protein Pmani_008667 [Petrolisthes manimaculis]|uniref:Uncharacterized protein n=1 Tax=Petrolisthes manimaculis TaxID=1843537 RepID=A0AAE1Q6C2_9EUCA|nr:hypothetical protein Pmani_008667 [Petrolisthes manimaculis]